MLVPNLKLLLTYTFNHLLINLLIVGNVKITLCSEKGKIEQASKAVEKAMSLSDYGSSIGTSTSVIIPAAATAFDEEEEDEYSQLPLFLNAKKKKLLLQGAITYSLIYSLTYSLTYLITHLLNHPKIKEERQKEQKAAEFDRKKSIKSSLSIAGLTENISKRMMNYMDITASCLCRVPMSKNIAIADKASDDIKFVNHSEWYSITPPSHSLLIPRK